MSSETDCDESLTALLFGDPAAEAHVAACARCNHRKADRLLAELGWTLSFTPATPPATIALLLGVGRRNPSWEPFLTPLTIPAGRLPEGSVPAG